MYLSKVILDPRYTVALNIIQNPLVLHSNVLTKPFGEARKESNVLTRLLRENDKYVLYVQSDKMPDWGSIEGNGIMPEAVRNIDMLKKLFQNGNCFEFDLRANPVRCRSGFADKSGKTDKRKRIFLSTAEERMQWLNRQAERNGFEIIHASEKKIEKQVVIKDGHRITLCTTDFAGVLKIKDNELFEKAFREGIGREKSYGCGMLMLLKTA